MPHCQSRIESLVQLLEPGLPFTSQEGQAFFRLPVPSSGGYLIFPVRSHAFRDWFYAAAYHHLNLTPSAYAFSLILTLLEARASWDPDNQRLNTFRRVAFRGSALAPNQILLDLANPEAQFVEISPTGWTVTAGANALLQSSRSTLQLPVPINSQPGTPLDGATPPSALGTLSSSLNLATAQDWLRCLTWLLAALRPTGPYPILVLRGPAASGKSFAARVLRSLIDPASAPLSTLPHNPDHLSALARQNWVLAFDHVSQLSPQLSDAFCRLASGAGASVRESPSSSLPRDLLLLNLRRPMIVTVTDCWDPAPDFASRALTVTLAGLPAEKRRPESGLLATLNAAYAGILGALCTAVSTALSRVPTIQPAAAPRYADALAWAMAAAPALGVTESAIQDALLETPPDPFLQALKSLLPPAGEWTGSATDLLASLPASPRYSDPATLSKYLKKRTAALFDAGLSTRSFRRPGGDRIIQIRCDSWTENSPVQLSQTPPSVPQTQAEKDLIAA